MGINELRTMHLGSKILLVNISFGFADGLTSSDVGNKILGLEWEIKITYPKAKRIFIGA